MKKNWKIVGKSRKKVGKIFVKKLERKKEKVGKSWKNVGEKKEKSWKSVVKK